MAVIPCAMWYILRLVRLVLVTQSCPTVGDSMDCSPWGSCVDGILQARILEWIAIPLSSGSSQPTDWTQVSCIAGRFFTVWATKETQRMKHIPEWVWTAFG